MSSFDEAELLQGYEEPDLGTFEDSPFYPGDDCDNFDTIIVVDNLPQIPLSKKDKLLKVFVKHVKAAGPINEASAIGDQGVEMPFGDDGSSKGYAFVEMAHPAAAASALANLDGLAFDKKHTFKCFLWADYARLSNITETYVAPCPEEYKEQGDVNSHLIDEQARDQYVIRYGNTTEVMWNDRDKPLPNLHEPRPDWTEKFVTWSPLGTYLLTVSERGVLLWGGDGFQRLQKFAHSNVQLVDFSPGERYLVTWSPECPDSDENMFVWDVKTGEVRRGFVTRRDQPEWPMMHWSADESVIMKQNEEDGSISCFELPSMQPACKRIKYPGATGPCFSPKDPIMCFWMPEQDQNPARVCLLEVPSRREVRSKILFNVARCRFFWHPSGEYLCVQVDRHSKSKKTIYTNFELFRVTAKDVPVEVLEFKDQVHAFAWEPQGCRFVVLHGEPPRIDVTFYTMGDEASKKPGVPLQVEKITTLEKKGVNEVRWSPRGHSLLLAGLRNLNGYLEWWNVDEMEMVQQDEHFMATDIDWDPTGRFVVTSVGAWRHTMENGYVVWSVLGKKIHTVQKTQFWQFMWRPRPKSLLTKEEEGSILKDWKTWKARFDAKDIQAREFASDEERQEHVRLLAEFEVQAAKWKSRHQQMAEMRYELRGYTSDEEQECVEVVETDETLLDIQEELLD
jgi:translation initiation factor 3 subunit B